MIPTARIKEAFSVCGIPVELHQEMHALKKQYGAPGDQIDYREMCEHVESLQLEVNNPLAMGEVGPMSLY